MGLDAIILVFWMLSFKSAFSLIKRLFSSSSIYAIRVESYVYLMLLIFFLTVLIPTYDSSSPAFHMMYSAYKLNKRGDTIQPFCIPFPVLNQSVVLCLLLTVASAPTYRLLRRQVRWSGISFSSRIFHGLLWSTQSNPLACCKMYLCNLFYTNCLRFLSSTLLLYFPSPCYFSLLVTTSLFSICISLLLFCYIHLHVDSKNTTN